MKRWTGGTVILVLGLLLVFRYYSMFFSFPSSFATSRRRRLPLFTPRAALLPALPGLDYLLPPPPSNSSSGVPAFSNSTLVWPHIRTLLLRSDALPGTADGVRDAAVAWQELLAALSEENEGSASSGAADGNSSCPFSVSGVAGGGTTVEIPCGFVDGSAVSVVGTPVRGFESNSSSSSRFWIQLLGSQLSGSRGAFNRPVVLHCNISLGEEGAPAGVMAQSSWTRDKGWSEWERCPDHSSADAGLQVDGLVRCNQQLGDSGISENANGTTDGVKTAEGSKRKPHLAVSFPFVEDEPFTATLWAGMEGFHLTVNGRHEMSFAYKENLDPWSVSEVRVAGNLDSLSLMVNGLPLSEDIDLDGDLENLKAPALLKKRLLMFVGVFSSVNNFERRMALRRSWMQYEAVRSGDIAVRFLVGLHKSKKVNIELWREAKRYGDIQFMPFVDYYSLITLKTVAACILGTKIYPAKYIMKTDDDAFVRIDQVLSSLKTNASDGLLYGLISFESSPIRDEDSKWFTSPEEWPHDTYPPWAHGPGYILSRDIAKFIVMGHQRRYLQLFKLEDVAMGIWIQEYKNTGQDVNYVNDDRFHNTGCEADYVLAHYQAPRLLLCLWDKLKREKEAICCE